MHPQLQSVTDEFAAAQERLHVLAASMPEEWWAERADLAGWSVGECVAHLNLTAEAYLPLIRRGIERDAASAAWRRLDSAATRPGGYSGAWQVRRCVTVCARRHRSFPLALSRVPLPSRGSTACRPSR